MDTPQLHILLVGGDEDNYNTICKLISKIEAWSCTPEWEPTAGTALAAMAGNRHDIYFVDAQPGLPLLRQALEQGCQTPIIFLAPPAEHATAADALNAGATDYLLKNQLDTLHLEQAIRRALNQAHTQQQHQKVAAAEREQRNFSKALQNVVIALNSTHSFDELLREILNNVGQVVPHDTADIMLLEGNRTRVVGEQGYVERGQPSIMGMEYALEDIPNFQQITKTKEPLVVANTTTHPNWVVLPETEWIRSFVGAPICLQGEVVGIINLSSATPDFYTQKQAGHLQAFANQAAVAIGNARLLRAEREQRQLAETMGRVGLALNSTLDLPYLLELICRESMALFNVKSVFLWLVQGDELVGYAGYGAGRENFVGLRRSVSSPKMLGARVVREKQPIIVNDTANSTRVDPTLVERFNVKSLMGVPLVTEDKAVGALMILENRHTHYFTEDNLNTAKMLGNYAAIAIQNAQLFQAEADRRREAEILYNATTTLTAGLDLKGVLENILAQLESVVPYDSVCVFLYQNNQLHIAACRGLSVDQLQKDFPADDPLLQELQQTLRPVILADAQKDPRFRGWNETSNVRGWMGVPIVLHKQFLGYITLDSHQYAAYDNVEPTLVQAFANQAAVAIANAQLFEQTQSALIEAEALYHVSRALIDIENLPHLLQTIADTISQTLSATWVALITLDFEAKKSKEIVVSGPPGVEITRTGNFEELMNGLTGWAVRNLKPALSPKGKPDPRESLQVQRHRAKKGFGAVIVVPLYYREKVLGTITAVNRIDEPDFTMEDVSLMATMANQAAVAIENAQLLQTAQEARQLSDSLREIGASLVETLDEKEVLTRILDGLGKVVPYKTASIMLVEGNMLKIKAGRGFPDNSPVWSIPFPINDDNVINTEIYKNKIPIVLPNTEEEPRFIRFEGLEYIKSWLGIPLIARDEMIGMLNLDHTQPNFYTQEHAAIASTFAQQAAIALDNARLFDETYHRAQQLAILNELAKEMTGLLKVQELCTTVAHRLHAALGYYNVAIFTANLTTQELMLQANAGAYTRLAQPGNVKIPFGRRVIGQAAQTGEPQVINDVREHPHFVEIEGMRTLSEVAIPLKVGDRLAGVLCADSDQLNAFDQAEVSALATVADQLATALEKARLFTETHQRAEQLEALRQASLSLTSSLELQEVLEAILRSSLALLQGSDNAHIFLYQAGRLTFGAALWSGATQKEPIARPRPHGLTYAVAQKGTPIIVPDMRTHPLFDDAPPEWTGSIIGLPLKISQRVVGVMTIACKQANVWSDDDLNVLFLLADQAAIAIENARLFEKEQKYTAELEERVAERTFKLQTLYELAHTLGHATHTGDVIRLTLLHLYQTVPHDVAASLLLTETTNTIVIQSQHALPENVEALIQEQLLKTAARLGGHTVKQKILEIHRIQPKDNAKLLAPLQELGSLVTVPILVDKNVVGLLLVATQQKDYFNEDQVRLLYIVANQVADTIGRLQSLLAAEHQRLENLVAHLPSGIVMLDAEQRMILANPVARQFLTRLTPAKLGEELTHLGQHPIENILESASSESPFTIEISEPPRQTIEITAKPIMAGPESGGWTLVITDVTEQRAIQKQIQQQERMAAVGQLAAGIAHDFNNILTSIIGFAELLLVDPGLSPAVKSDVERITKQGHRAAHLVRQILDFSRQTISAKQQLNLIPFIKETIKLLERTIPEDINILFQAEPGEYRVRADITQMQQALTNLAVNARDAMPNGGDLKIHLSEFTLDPHAEPPCPDMPSGHWVSLSITDTGVGILPEHQGQIFEPFFTTKEVGEGTGLGLAQVYGIIKQHEGYINVKSWPKTGTMFTLYLPALPTSPQDATAEARSEIPRGHNEIILLVEDDATVLVTATSMLKHLGYQVLTATNGHEALKVYEQHQHEIALVLTDMTMPKMGGTELTLALRRQNPNIKVVALTGYPLEIGAKDALMQGMVDWLQKPLTIKQLAQTVNRTLNLPQQP